MSTKTELSDVFSEDKGTEEYKEMWLIELADCGHDSIEYQKVYNYIVYPSKETAIQEVIRDMILMRDEQIEFQKRMNIPVPPWPRLTLDMINVQHDIINAAGNIKEIGVGMKGGYCEYYIVRLKKAEVRLLKN